jgi:hypothetical protein
VDGGLVLGYRDATFINKPSLGDHQGHAVVFTHRYAVGSGMEGMAAACDPTRILIDDGMLFATPRITNPVARCKRPACRALLAEADRQHRDLERIRSYYRLEERHGICVGLGLRVRHVGRPGVIIDTAEQLLVVRLDDEPKLVRAHPTASLEYEGPDGWVRAVPVDNPASPAAV